MSCGVECRAEEFGCLDIQTKTMPLWMWSSTVRHTGEAEDSPLAFITAVFFFFLVWAMSSFDSPMADTALYGAPTVKVAPAPRAALWGQPITDAWVNSKGLLWNNAKHEKLSAAQWSTLDYRGTDACWGKPASVLGLAGWHTWSRGWLCWLFVNAATCSLKGYSGVSLIYSLTHRDTE